MPPISIDEIIEKVNALLDKIADRIEQIRQKVNSILSKVPGFLRWAVDKFLDAWNAMLKKLGEFWDWFTDKLASVGDPFGLVDTGSDWHTMLGEPGKQAADSIDDEHELLVDDTWTGLAATAYKDQVPAQESALRSLGQTFASSVASSLKTLSFGIAAFWILVISALVTLVLALVAATAATGSIMGLPAVPVLIVSGIVAFLVQVGGGLATLTFTASSAADGFRNITRYATDWPEFAV